MGSLPSLKIFMHFNSQLHGGKKHIIDEIDIVYYLYWFVQNENLFTALGITEQLFEEVERDFGFGSFLFSIFSDSNLLVMLKIAWKILLNEYMCSTISEQRHELKVLHGLSNEVKFEGDFVVNFRSVIEFAV
jgi:hypothetical protein